MDEITTELDAEQRELLLKLVKDVESGKYTPPPKVSDDYLRYAKDPVGYVQEVLGARLTPDQKKICLSVLHNKYTLVRASHGIGKSFLAAALALWHFDCLPRSLTLTTAPTSEQVKGIVWGEIRNMVGNRPGLMPSAPLLKGNSPNHKIEGLTARDDNSFQGRHAENFLIIFDEAVGIKEAFWNAADGMLVGPQNKLLAICNPTDTTSAAYKREMASKGRAGDNVFNVIQVPGINHPNIRAALIGRPDPFPGAVSIGFIEQSIEKWASPIHPDDRQPSDIEWPPNSNEWYRPGPLFESRVLGRWPSTTDNAVWSESLFYQAFNASLELDESADIEIGADIARFGTDDSVFHIRQGYKSIHHEFHNGWDTRRTARRLRELCDAFSYKSGQKPTRIKVKVDVDGVGGAVIDQREGYNFIPVSAASKPKGDDPFPNRRSELWFVTAEKARNNMVDFSDIDEAVVLDRIMPQLMSPTWKVDAMGRRVIEPKDITKKRIGRSPDDADAINLCYAEEHDDLSPIVIHFKPRVREQPTPSSPGDVIDWRSQLPGDHPARKDYNSPKPFGFV